MIARGDLAVEVGYLRVAELQEEILWLCEAAHVPVIWAVPRALIERLGLIVAVFLRQPRQCIIADAAFGGMMIYTVQKQIAMI